MSRYKIVVFSEVKGILDEVRSRLPNTISEKIAVKQIDVKNDLPADDISALKDAEIILTEPSLIAKHKMIYDLPNLKWMQSTWAGVDGFIKHLVPDKPFPAYKLTRFTGYFGQHMSEFVIGHIIAHERGFAELNNNQKNKEWPGGVSSGIGNLRQYRLLSQLTIGILGLGSIGKDVAKACHFFGMKVHGFIRREPDCKLPYVDKYRMYNELPELLSECDYLCNILPSTPATKHLLDGDVLKYAVKKPVFINIGRGDLLPEKSLIKALTNGWLSHAILDVYELEPLPRTSPLWDHPLVTVRPHISGVTKDFQIAELFCKNLEKYIDGEDLPSTIDWEAGY